MLTVKLSQLCVCTKPWRRKINWPTIPECYFHLGLGHPISLVILFRKCLKKSAEGMAISVLCYWPQVWDRAPLLHWSKHWDLVSLPHHWKGYSRVGSMFGEGAGQRVFIDLLSTNHQTPLVIPPFSPPFVLPYLSACPSPACKPSLHLLSQLSRLPAWPLPNGIKQCT